MRAILGCLGLDCVSSLYFIVLSKWLSACYRLQQVFNIFTGDPGFLTEMKNW